MNKREEINILVKDSIAQSIFFYMQSKKFSDITITEIIKKAGVARASFYRNFTFKEDAISYYLVKVMTLYKNKISKSTDKMNNYELILATIRFALDYQKELDSLFKSGLSQLFLEAINIYLLGKNDKFQKKSNLEKYFLFSYGGSIFNVIYHWIESGAHESPEQITRIICETNKFVLNRN